VFADFDRCPSPTLLRLEHTDLRRGTTVILRDVDVAVGRSDRVHITGDNGAGKTTLLEAMVSACPHRSRLLYLPQELATTAVTAATQRLHALASVERGQVLAIVAALGTDPEGVLRSIHDGMRLSPGEQRKLVLALALRERVHALVMDEPTNHLDLPSLELLEAALREYPGAVVLVTHDHAFARNTTDQCWQVANGGVVRTPMPTLAR
jgi:ATPase subunit of ABC transporter with duplicated ATPase domains